MSKWLRNLPAYEIRPGEVGAEHFNRIRLALARLSKTIRFSLADLRGLDFVLEDRAWIVIDRTLNDIPVLAWTDFQTLNRALHTPVSCQIRLYHAHGEVIHDKVLELTKEYLKYQLRIKK